MQPESKETALFREIFLDVFLHICYSLIIQYLQVHRRALSGISRQN